MYSLRLQAHAATKDVAASAVVRGGYTDSRQLRVGDQIPQVGSDPLMLLLFQGIAAWTIDSIENDGLLHCLPSPTQAD